MSEQLSADAAGIAAYGATAATNAAELTAAAAAVAAAGPGLLDPVFGLIGGDFLAAYATVGSAHIESITKLSATVGSMSAAAQVTAANYLGRDAMTAAALLAAEPGLL